MRGVADWAERPPTLHDHLSTTQGTDLLKTISCGDVRREHVGKAVTLCGWVHRRRDHGSLTFIDLRDREGIVQVVFNPEHAADAHGTAVTLRNEWVISVVGQVQQRPEGTENPGLDTGEVEVAAELLTVLNESKTPPFYVNDESDEVDELVRMKYRYVDLRRAGMRDILTTRHRVVKFIRDFLDKRGFLEIETPILIKSTPEGARTSWCPAGYIPGASTPYPNRPSSSSSSLWLPVSRGISRSHAASATRIRGPTALWNTPSSTLR